MGRLKTNRPIKTSKGRLNADTWLLPIIASRQDSSDDLLLWTSNPSRTDISGYQYTLTGCEGWHRKTRVRLSKRVQFGADRVSGQDTFIDIAFYPRNPRTSRDTAAMFDFPCCFKIPSNCVFKWIRGSGRPTRTEMSYLVARANCDVGMIWKANLLVMSHLLWNGIDRACQSAISNSASGVL